MHKKTLYLHIGCHKTGTTSIQRTLQANEGRLPHQGITFFYRNCDTGENLLPELHSWLTFNRQHGLLPDGMRLRNVSDLARQLSAIDSDVVVSSENFSFVFDPEEIAKLQKALSKYFDSLKVICYIRRQDQHIASHHQEGSKLFRRPEYDLFSHDPFAIPAYVPRHDLYLDYDKRLGYWGDAFGDDNLIIKIYDRALLKEGDAVEDFFELIGVTEFDKVEELNPSVSGLEAKLGHIINGSGVRNKAWISSLLKPRFSQRDRLSPSRDEAREYYRHYIKSNERLNRRFCITSNPAIFSDDFSGYPERKEDSWSEHSANQAISKILEVFDEVYGGMSVDEVRDAAIALEDRRPLLSYKLMLIAGKLRPEGELIRQKLEQYEIRLKEMGRLT